MVATLEISLKILSGIGSKHDDGFEDRIFKFKSCWPDNANDRKIDFESDLLPDQTGTDWDATWTLECPSNSVITYLRSEHDDDYEDRKYTMRCNGLFGAMTYFCTWSSYVNSYDAEFWYECPNNKVMAGIRSSHNNDYEDRIYSFKCCTILPWN